MNGDGRKSYRPKGPAEVRRNMSAIRSTGTTEVRLRKTLHAMGFRYRINYRKLPGKPDIVFPRQRIAVFIDGDFWHGRMLQESGNAALEHYFRRNESRAYWIAKIRRTVERDSEVTASLEAQGWTVIRYWESEVKKRLRETAHAIADFVLQRNAILNNGVNCTESEDQV